jgi:nucleotide-binding universal stress UspA family protein
VDASVEAQLLVVGARAGRGGVEHLPLGSVAMAMLASARSPVGIVHPGDTGG